MLDMFVFTSKEPACHHRNNGFTFRHSERFFPTYEPLDFMLLAGPQRAARGAGHAAALPHLRQQLPKSQLINQQGSDRDEAVLLRPGQHAVQLS